MTLPDSGQVEDYSEAEMNELLALFESDKAKLTKNQKAAVARFNFKKNKGEPIPYRGSAAQAGAQPGAPAAPVPAAAGADITALLPPEIQLLAGKDPATLTKEEKIALAKAKSQAVRAASAVAKPADADKPKGPSPEEVAAKKALEFAVAQKLQARFPNAIGAWAMQTDMPYATVQAERIVDVVRYLHMEMGFDYLRDLTAVDYPPDRLEVIYNLMNMGTKEEVALKVKLPRSVPGAVVDTRWHKVGLAPDMPSIQSITHLHAGADWLERETFDLLGIQFTGHPFLVRLMLPDGWVGHPLRKDYDLTKEQYVGLDERGNDIVSFREEDGW